MGVRRAFRFSLPASAPRTLNGGKERKRGSCGRWYIIYSTLIRALVGWGLFFNIFPPPSRRLTATMDRRRTGFLQGKKTKTNGKLGKRLGNMLHHAGSTARSVGTVRFPLLFSFLSVPRSLSFFSHCPHQLMFFLQRPFTSQTRCDSGQTTERQQTTASDRDELSPSGSALIFRFILAFSRPLTTSVGSCSLLESLVRETKCKKKTKDKMKSKREREIERGPR